MSKPTIKELAVEVYGYGQDLATYDPDDLREPGSDPEDAVGGDFRLQIHDGTWYTHTGDSQYDQDHRGNWGSSFVPAKVTKAQAREIAADLISQASE